MVWVSKELDLLTNKVDLLPRVISDHSPVMWKMREQVQTYKTWIINEDLLDNQDTVDQIKTDIKNYFEINATPETKSSTLWDEFKAVIRGKLINLNS